MAKRCGVSVLYCTADVCVSSSGVCRIKLCGYATFIVNADSAVCSVCWRHFLNFLSCPQEERRRIGTPTARARVWDRLSFAILFSALFGSAMFGLSVSQVPMEFGLDKRAQTLQGLAFPLQEEAKRALQQLKQRRINYIQLVRQPNCTSERVSHK